MNVRAEWHDSLSCRCRALGEGRGWQSCRLVATVVGTNGSDGKAQAAQFCGEAHLGPAVALHAELVVRVAGLQQRLLCASASSDLTHHRAARARQHLKFPRSHPERMLAPCWRLQQLGRQCAPVRVPALATDSRGQRRCQSYSRILLWDRFPHVPSGVAIPAGTIKGERSQICSPVCHSARCQWLLVAILMYAGCDVATTPETSQSSGAASQGSGWHEDLFFSLAKRNLGAHSAPLPNNPPRCAICLQPLQMVWKC